MASDLLFPWSAEAGPLSQVWIFSAGSSDPTALPLNFRGISTINQVDNLKRRRKRRDLSGARNPDVSEPLNTRPFVKRRRLTRNFMTSPLSQPYACPGSYICGRGLPRVALWARFGTDCRQELRKAAMMNALRRRAVMPNQEIERRRFEAEGHSFL